MNWRRGLLLAGINLAMAGPLIVQTELEVEAYVREHYVASAQHAEEQAPKSTSLEDGGVRVDLDPCNWVFHYRARHRFVHMAEMFAAGLSGWDEECPAHWSLAGILKVGYSWVETPSEIPRRREVACGFGLLIAVQWILVGAFPLIRPKRWWAEPGAFITICAVIAFAFALIRPIEELALFPAFFAALAWFWWTGLLLWTCVRAGWRLIAGRRAAAS
jgi:hypothetical protein